MSPRDDAQRGSQVCLSHPRDRLPGGAGADRPRRHRRLPRRPDLPDILRFGFTPLYLRFVDAWDAAEHLRQVLDSGEWQRPEFNQRHAVT